MSKVVDLKSPNTIDSLVEKIKENKSSFIPPKAKMKQSVENDAKYLVALGQFIQHAQKEMERLNKAGKMYEASKIQIEIFDAIGKYQANEGLVNDKSTHYEKVFLPMYEKELEESRASFEGMYNQCKELLSNMTSSEDEEISRMIGFIKKEVGNYDSALSDLKKDEEYQNYMYKIFKRLYNKTIELAQAKANA